MGKEIINLKHEDGALELLPHTYLKAEKRHKNTVLLFGQFPAFLRISPKFCVKYSFVLDD